MLLSYKPLHLEAQQRLQEEGCVVDITKRLSLNRTKGPIFGGIYASCLAAHFNIPIRHYEKEEKLMPPVYLDYKSMVAHDFIVKHHP